MDGISRSRGWDKEILHGVLPMELPVLSDKRARNCNRLRPSVPLSVVLSPPRSLDEIQPNLVCELLT